MSEHEQAMNEAAAALTASLIGAPPVEDAPELELAAEAEAPEVSEQPAAAPVEPHDEAAPAAPFDLNPKLPEDIEAELAEADIDDEVDAEVAAYVPETDDYGDPVEDTDAVRERIKLQKRVDFLEKQVVQSKAGQWRKEAEQYFPLAKHALDDIAGQATSRRKYLALARAEHERILPHIQQYLSEAKEYRDAEVELAKDEVRATQTDAWGEPLTDPNSALSAPAVDREKRVQSARENIRDGKGGLAKLFVEMFK